MAILPLGRVGDKRAGVDVVVDDRTGEVVALRLANSTERHYQIVVGDAGRIAHNARLSAGAAAKEVPIDPPLSSASLRWTLTG